MRLLGGITQVSSRVLDEARAPGPVGWILWAAVFVAVAAGTLWLLDRRGRRRRAQGGGHPLGCPACGRGYPLGARFCVEDAERLLPRGEGAIASRGQGGRRCPRCLRVFSAATRFCPLDAEELVAGLPDQGDGREAWDHDHVLLGDDKICPVCASRYGLDAAFCGRDGSALVSVN